MENIIKNIVKDTVVNYIKEFCIPKTNENNLYTKIIIPVNCMSCYFCMLNKSCERCDYDKIHGKCNYLFSDYRYIYNKIYNISEGKSFFDKSEKIYKIYDEIIKELKNLLIKLN